MTNPLSMYASPPNRREVHEDVTRRILSAADVVERHLSGAVSVESMADAACYSLFHFCRTFNRFVRLSPYDFAMRRRLSEAAGKVVAWKSMSITDIALAHGFETPEGFSRAFKRMFGVLPSQARKTGGVDSRRILRPLDRQRIRVASASFLREPIVRNAPQVLNVRAVDSLDAAVQDIKEARAGGGDGTEGGEVWIGAFYAAGGEAYPEHVFVGAAEDGGAYSSPFQSTVPAGTYRAVAYDGPAADLPLLAEIVFSTLWPRLSDERIPDRFYIVYAAGGLTAMLPEPAPAR